MMFKEFDLCERDADTDNEAAALARLVLREGYNLPRDTFVTGDIPMLLARLSLAERELLTRKAPETSDAE